MAKSQESYPAESIRIPGTWGSICFSRITRDFGKGNPNYSFASRYEKVFN